MMEISVADIISVNSKSPYSEQSYKSSIDSKKWYEPNTYYQILCVEPSGKKKEKERKYLTTSVLARKRGHASENKATQTANSDNFASFELDRETIEKLKDYPRHGDADRLSSYLPSPGVILPDDYIKALSNGNFNLLNQQTELGIYHPIKTLLHSRKISQLIAKTWWAYIEAKKTGLWKKFTAGEWDEINSDILDGLISREIFLFAGGNSPDTCYPEEPDIYNPVNQTDKTGKETSFLILPTNKSWSGISLSLLLAGQAFYLNKKENKYHQICQPILSTSEIVLLYCLEVDWNTFDGVIKEMTTNEKSPWVVHKTIVPYPPIPSERELDIDDIKKWADAEDDGGDLPFYKKTDNGKYSVDIEYFRSPYPYIPLTCS